MLAGDAIDSPLANMGADSLDGGAGSDWLFGFLGDDSLVGGADDDHLYGDTRPGGTPSFNYEWPGLITPVAAVPFASLTGGADYLDGGAGDDYLQGDGGNDVLLGGADNEESVAAGATMCLSSGCGKASNTRRCICTPTRLSAQPNRDWKAT